jgi:hypothetical protein
VIKISNDKYKIIKVIHNTIGKFKPNDIIVLQTDTKSFGLINQFSKLEIIDYNYFRIVDSTDVQLYYEEIDDKLGIIYELINKFESTTNSETYSSIKKILDKFVLPND